MENIKPTAAQVRSNMFWNVAGSFVFMGAQWVMTVLIVYLADFEEAGYLSLGISLTNVFTNIAYFSIRNFQVSDAQDKYSDGIYLGHRIVFTALAFISGAVFVLVNGYSLYLTLFLLLFMLYRLSEPFVDVFHGIDQKLWRLDICGKSFVLRGLLGLAAFVLVEKLTGSLLYTTTAMLVVVVLLEVFWDYRKTRKLKSLVPEFGRAGLLSLTREAFPLFIYGLALNGVVPVTRYFLEKLQGSEKLGFYSSVAIPASVVQLLSSYVFGTFTALFAAHWKEKNLVEFRKLFLKLLSGLCIFIAMAIGGSVILGEWVLCLVFTEKIRPYAYLLHPTVFCCGMIALIWYLGTVLTVVRDGKGLTVGAVAGVLTALAVSCPAIKLWGVDGVNAALFLSSLITLIIFVYRYWLKVYKTV